MILKRPSKKRGRNKRCTKEYPDRDQEPTNNMTIVPPFTPHQRPPAPPRETYTQMTELVTQCEFFELIIYCVVV